MTNYARVKPSYRNPLSDSKIPLLRSAAASLLLIFSLYARVKPNASFAVAWFPSSLQKSLLKVSLQKANKRVTTSVLFRAHTRNLSKYRSFRYSSAITGGTCRSLSHVTSVRCSKAIFQVHSIHPSQPGHLRRSELFLLPCP